MLDHLLPREAFLNRYADRARRLGLSPEAHEDFAPDLSQLDEDLYCYDRTYAKHAKTFWVNKDSMQIRTLKGSLIARQHHRYLSGKSTLLYQHVTANCICLFTQALLCNVSEAIHMLVGALQCRNGQEDIINICDSAGKSHLVLGLSRLLNILEAS